MPVDEHMLRLDGSPVFYRGAASPPTTPVYLHTAPSSSDDWAAVAERTGGIAPDLIGFGRSGKGGHLDYSPSGMAASLHALLAELGVDEVALAGHGWGAAAAVEFAAREPGRVRRLALIDPAPPLDGHWHRLARLWRTPVIGELVMGSMSRSALAWLLRRASAQPQVWPRERVRAVWDQFDQGTQRATLRLHRWTEQGAIDQLAARLPELTIPTLLMCGEVDPWFGPGPAGAWLSRLRQARFELVSQAGHWPWLERQEAAQRIVEFMCET